MITTWTPGTPDVFMPEGLLVRLEDRVRRHPWWRARARLVLEILDRWSIAPPARILDAGCGWGVTLDAIEARGYRATGLDVSRQMLDRLDRPGRSLIEADLTGLSARERTDRPEFDAVLALDVIEHLDDDRAALSSLGDLIRPGGVIVVSVPAMPELYSEFDAVQGHRRRYLPADLRAAFDPGRLVIEDLFWWGRWLVPLFRLKRSRTTPAEGRTPEEVYLEHLSLPPWPLPRLFDLAFAWEHRRALRGALRCGTSLIAVARRPLASPHVRASSPIPDAAAC